MKFLFHSHHPYDVYIQQKALRFFLFFLLLFKCSLGYSNPNPVYIVRDQNPQADIVLASNASPQLHNIANLFQDYIRRSTGATLPIVSAQKENDISIHIGLTPFVQQQHINLKTLEEDGFLLQRINATNFIIIGGSDWGTEFGVYSFLERYLGVTWLMPGDVGTEIPKHTTLTLPNVKITDNPVYISRQVSPVDINAKDILGIWGRNNRLRGHITFHHNLLNLLNPKQFFKSNPEFYPSIDGKQEMPQAFNWQPNFSAQGIDDTAASVIIRYFKQNPKITSYSLGMNDTHNNFDESFASKARRNGKTNYLGLEDVSNDYFTWANAVAKKVNSVYPDKLFGLLAYYNVAEPPSENIGVDSHIVPFLTYERMRWSNADLKNQGHQLTEAWGKMCEALGWYDYDYGLCYLVPRVWFHTMQEYLIWGAQHKVKYYYAELYPKLG